MSTAAAAASSNAPKTWSIGPWKVQVMDVALVSGDTSVTVTADTMSRVVWASLSVGVTQTAAPTYATNVATFTVTNPAASIYAQAIVIGV